MMLILLKLHIHMETLKELSTEVAALRKSCSLKDQAVSRLEKEVQDLSHTSDALDIKALSIQERLNRGQQEGENIKRILETKVGLLPKEVSEMAAECFKMMRERQEELQEDTLQRNLSEQMQEAKFEATQFQKGIQYILKQYKSRLIIKAIQQNQTFKIMHNIYDTLIFYHAIYHFYRVQSSNQALFSQTNRQLRYVARFDLSEIRSLKQDHQSLKRDFLALKTHVHSSLKSIKFHFSTYLTLLVRMRGDIRKCGTAQKQALTAIQETILAITEASGQLAQLNTLMIPKLEKELQVFQAREIQQKCLHARYKAARASLKEDKTLAEAELEECEARRLAFQEDVRRDKEQRTAERVKTQELYRGILAQIDADIASEGDRYQEFRQRKAEADSELQRANDERCRKVLEAEEKRDSVMRETEKFKKQIREQDRKIDLKEQEILNIDKARFIIEAELKYRRKNEVYGLIVISILLFLIKYLL